MAPAGPRKRGALVEQALVFAGDSAVGVHAGTGVSDALPQQPDAVNVGGLRCCSLSVGATLTGSDFRVTVVSSRRVFRGGVSSEKG
jgi:hypothetical protein